ncbi:hypothetical protein AB6A40_002562 [Gnathostoma spinigerum]|uniref:Uncharacterized protein n=1 Tax=Gnathostoma spinigerum TaxID=75299 RepID=A0ABD6EFZ8_9BILA
MRSDNLARGRGSGGGGHSGHRGGRGGFGGRFASRGRREGVSPRGGGFSPRGGRRHSDFGPRGRGHGGFSPRGRGRGTFSPRGGGGRGGFGNNRNRRGGYAGGDMNNSFKNSKSDSKKRRFDENEDPTPAKVTRSFSEMHKEQTEVEKQSPFSKKPKKFEESERNIEQGKDKSKTEKGTNLQTRKDGRKQAMNGFAARGKGKEKKTTVEHEDEEVGLIHSYSNLP